MGRSFSLAVLLGLLIAMTPATAAAQSSCDGSFQAKLKCWAAQVQKGERVEVTLPLKLDDKTPFSGWSYLGQVRKGPGRLVVSVPAGKETGIDGTMLLISAHERRVSSDSKITTLDEQILKPTCGLIPDTKACDAVSKAIHQTSTVQGKDLVAAEVATEISGSLSRTVIFAALVLLVGLLGLVFFLSRGLRASTGHRVGPAPAAQPVPAPPYRQPEPAHRRPQRRRFGRRAAVPDGPRRAAVVRSDLHPQGYVEVDRCLFRVVWTDDQTSAPDVGEAVDVIQGVGQDSDLLLALPPGAGQ